MIQLKRIGHVALRVADPQRSKNFYSDVLGFEVVEEDPDHGAIFMTLGDSGHAVDLFPDPEAHAATKRTVGIHHIAFQVDSFDDLRQAYFTLEDHGVTVRRAVDHVTQQSIYFSDPDGNGLEIYVEHPDALDMFRSGREDRDDPLTFER